MARILIVDDDEMDRVLLSHLLGEAGHELRFASDGLAALETFLREPADLVVTDIAMPELNGMQLIRALHDDDPWVRIIAVSGTSAVNLERAKELGALAVLEKPLDPQKLLEAVQKALDDHGHWLDTVSL
jgi:CheY-like chemotaxis protein